MSKWIILSRLTPYNGIYHDAIFIEGTYEDASQESKWLSENLVTTYDLWYELTGKDSETFDDIKKYCKIKLYEFPDKLFDKK